jgi:aspartate carbamoyltransferase catalytic subunit
MQLDKTKKFKHLLTIADLPVKDLQKILTVAKKFSKDKMFIAKVKKQLQDKIVVNLFFESSTRTRCSFEIAEKKLGLQVINLDFNVSSTQKGETLLDTFKNLQAMGVDLCVLRHPDDGIPRFIAEHLENVVIINAGDGTHEHPTQALLDMLTIQQHKKDFSSLVITIVGDVLHSRVARSDIYALRKLGTKYIRVVAPKNLLPADAKNLGITVFDDLKTAVKDADIIMTLRLQKERMKKANIVNEAEYAKLFGLTPDILKEAKKDVLIMAPGPINRGVEITSDVADGPCSIILEQAHNGVAVRMAVLAMLLGATAVPG